MRKNKIDNLTRFIKFRNRIIETMSEKFIQSSVGTTFQFKGVNNSNIRKAFNQEHVIVTGDVLVSLMLNPLMVIVKE
jgi:hypothetical protein